MIIKPETQVRPASSNRFETEIQSLPDIQTQTAFTISVIVPTRNEAGNIEPLLSRIDEATRGVPVEVVFVDDSTDNTPQVIRDLQNRFSLSVVLIARPPER